MNVLTNRTVKSTPYFSRYNGLNYYYNNNDDKYQLETRQWLAQLSDSAAVTTHIVKKGETYDWLALKYYNNPTYYWIICDYNRIIDPLKNPKAGDVLYIPALNAGLQFISNDRWRY